MFRQKFPDWIETSDTGAPLDPQVLLEIFSRKMLDFNPAKVTQIQDVDGELDIWVAKDHGKVCFFTFFSSFCSLLSTLFA